MLLTAQEQDELKQLHAILKEHHALTCPNPECGHGIGFGDIAWNNASTEAGTPCAFVEIQCAVCDTEIAAFRSWYPGIDDTEDLLYALDSDWRK